MSDSLWPHGLQHARLLCPPLSSRVCADSCPLSRWCYLTTLSSATPLSFCLQSFSGSGSFPISSLHQVAKVLGLQLQTSVLPMNIQGWFSLGLTGLISLQLKGLSRLFSTTTVWKYQFFGAYSLQLSNPHTALTIGTFVRKVMSFLFHTLSRFVIAFSPRSKCLLISWLQFPSAVILEPKKIKSVSTFFPSICYEVMGPDAMISFF